METETGDETGQRALLACGMQEDSDEEWSPSDRSHALNTCSHPGGEGWGVPLTWQRVPTVRIQGMEGDPLT